MLKEQEINNLKNFLYGIAGYINPYRNRDCYDNNKYTFIGIDKEGKMENKALKVNSLENYKGSNLIDKITQILEDNKDNNIYITSPLFAYKKGIIKRNMDYVIGTNMLFIDIDDIKNPIDNLGDIENYLYQFNIFNENFFPTFIVKSGNGLHLYFALDDFCLYNNTNLEYFYSILYSFHLIVGSDTKAIDKTRYLRLPYSYNCKDKDNKKRVELFDTERYEPYSMKDMYYHLKSSLNNEQLEELNKYVSKKMGYKTQSRKTKKEKVLREPKQYEYELTDERKRAIEEYIKYTQYQGDRDDNTYKLRIDFLSQLVEYRNENNLIIGHRNHLIMVLTRLNINANKTLNDSLKMAKEFNNKFILPLQDYEVENIVNYLYDNNKEDVILMSNESIQKFLEITPEEQDLNHKIDLFPNHKLFKKSIYKKIMRETSIIPTNRKIKEQHYFQILRDNPNATNKELMEIMNLSKSQVIRIKNKYKKSV